MRIKPINFAYVLILSFLIISCNSESDNNNETDSIEIQKNDTIQSKIDSIEINTDNLKDLKSKQNNFKSSKYICPQGDTEGNLNKTGICPVCEMELIENPDFTDKNSKK